MMSGSNELVLGNKSGNKGKQKIKNKKNMEYKNAGKYLNDSHDALYRQNKYIGAERAVFSSHTRTSDTYGNNFYNKSKGNKNIREFSAAKYSDIGTTKLLVGSSSIKTFKSASSHASSLKNLNHEKIHTEDMHKNNLIEEQLHSSSSAETIAIKDKILFSDAQKLKDYTEELQRSKAYLTHSSNDPKRKDDFNYKSKRKNDNKIKENASSISSNSLKNMNLFVVNDSISKSRHPKDHENYFSNEEGNIDSEIVSSDGYTAINDMDLHKNLNIEKNLFIRDYSKQGNQPRGLSLQRRDMLDKFWIENQSPDKASIQISKYLQKVQRGLNTIERLKLWRSLPHHIEYMDYYKSK